MTTAFVLINTETGSKVLPDLKKIDGVQEAFAIYGVYDIVARINAESMVKLKELITWRIRRLENIKSTLTMIVMEE